MDGNSLNRADVHMLMCQCVTGQAVYSISGSKGCLSKRLDNNPERNARKGLICG
jgi:hypothetical protein